MPGEAADPLAPEKVSPAVVWLCSDEASDVTGRIFAVGGNCVYLLSWAPLEIARRPNEEDAWSVAEVGDKIRQSVEQWPERLTFQDLI